MNDLEALEQLRNGTAVVDRSDHDFVAVTGPDAFSFLQALVSIDVDALADGEGAHGLLLSPQGKLDVDFRILRVGDTAWLDCETGLGAQLAASLNRFKIRVEAEVVDRSGELGMFSFVGPADDDVPSTLHAHHAVGDARAVRTLWGFDLIGPRAVVAAAAAERLEHGWSTAGAGAYEAWRIEQGVPRQPVDIDASTIPQEAFLERDAVSFTKGCFLGQELVCRIDSRGHVNRFLRRITAIEGDWPEPGADVVFGAKVVGALTSVAPADLPTGALGYVRREVEPPATIELRWPGGAARATVETIGAPES
jgi:folate-binding protein YgfZ